jgi:hypothetical protein
MPARATAVRFDIAGDELHDARAAGQHGVPTWVSSGCRARRALGRAGGRCARPSPAWARRRRGDSAGNLTRAGRGGARGTVCAGVCTRVRLLLPERKVGVVTGCRGGVHCRARLDAMGGGERGARGWLARTRRGAGGVCRRPRTRRFLLLATARASHKAMEGSRRRGRPRHGGERRRRHKKGPKARPCLQGYGARVLGCTLASATARTGARADTHATRVH